MCLGAGLVGATTLAADQRENVDRLNTAAEVFQQIMATPDRGIPQELLEKAQCVVIVPGVKKGAFIVGAEYGKGYFACREHGGRGWTAPGAVIVEGGSFGFQIGGEETDVVMLVMNEDGERRLLSSQFKLGADASVAAGPVGRTTQAGTDLYMTAQILSWSRSRGVFAGLSLAGATVRQDLKDNQALYGSKLSNKDIIEGNTPVPPAAEQLVRTIDRFSPRKNAAAQ
jgi:lipid-binding SYLF domain-containing protein